MTFDQTQCYAGQFWQNRREGSLKSSLSSEFEQKDNEKRTFAESHGVDINIEIDMNIHTINRDSHRNSHIDQLRTMSARLKKQKTLAGSIFVGGGNTGLSDGISDCISGPISDHISDISTSTTTSTTTSENTNMPDISDRISRTISGSINDGPSLMKDSLSANMPANMSISDTISGSISGPISGSMDTHASLYGASVDDSGEHDQANYLATSVQSQTSTSMSLLSHIQASSTSQLLSQIQTSSNSASGSSTASASLADHSDAVSETDSVLSFESRETHDYAANTTDPLSINGNNSTLLFDLNSIQCSNTAKPSGQQHGFAAGPRGRSISRPLGNSPLSNHPFNARAVSPSLNSKTAEDPAALTVLSGRYLFTSKTSSEFCSMVDSANEPVVVDLQTTLKGNWHLNLTNAKILSETKQLTFYRRNLFSSEAKVCFSRVPVKIRAAKTSSVKTDSNIGSPSDMQSTEDASSSDYETIERTALSLKLVSWSEQGKKDKKDRKDKKIKKKDAELVDKAGAPLSELDVSLNSSDLSTDSLLHEMVYGFKKIKFSSATVNNGAPNKQPFFQVQTILTAYTNAGNSIVMAETLSKPIVVRGRHPSFYKDRFALTISGDMISNRMAAVAGTAKQNRAKQNLAKSKIRSNRVDTLDRDTLDRGSEEDPNETPSDSDIGNNINRTHLMSDNDLFYMNPAYSEHSHTSHSKIYPSQNELLMAPVHEHQDHDLCTSDTSEFQDDLSCSETSSHLALDFDNDHHRKFGTGMFPLRGIKADGADLSYEYFPLDANNKQDQTIYGYYYPHYEHLCGADDLSKKYKPGQMFYRALEYLDD